jgi:hypothetical protein
MQADEIAPGKWAALAVKPILLPQPDLPVAAPSIPLQAFEALKLAMKEFDESVNKGKLG